MIEQVAETGSTNRLLAERGREGAPEGLWIRADRQSGGRGRQGRRWESPEGNLYASTLVRMRDGDPPAQSLALVSGIAVWEAVRLAMGGAGDLAIKWPNDLLLAGAKLAGMLLERHGDAIIVGIGVNLSHAPKLPDRPTAALGDLGATPDPQSFCETLADVFAVELSIWRNAGLGETRKRWLSRALPKDAPMRYHGEGGQPEDGLFETINDEGALVLRRADGTRMTVTAGDVDLLNEE